jgi:membrane-bound metal-dependent hydrolase YbcI (DUF457 family)
MPSPIIHSATGYLIYRLAKDRLPSVEKNGARLVPVLLVTSLLFSLLPDFDALPGLLAGDMGRFHNHWTHSLVVGLGLAMLGASLIRWRYNSGFLIPFLVAFSSYALHVVMDYFTYDSRGVMFVWPFSSDRFASDFILFYGVRWSEGWLAVEHLMTLATELIFVMAIYGLVFGVGKIRLRMANGGD